MIIDDIINKIKSSNKIAISFHISPDGDSIGSSLGLLNGLRSIGKETYILSKEVVPESFEFLNFAREIDGNHFEVEDNTDLLITLDCGNIERLNFDTSDMISEDKKYTVINIDHHVTNDSFGDLNYINTKAASVGEIVYDLLSKMNISIDRTIAACLYTSILTDTGSFRFSNTTLNTHVVAGNLISTGLDFSEIHRKIFDNKKFEALKLQALVLNDMYLTFNNKLCVMKVTHDFIEKANAEDVDTGDLVSLGLKVNTAEVCMLLKEKDDCIKVSLRSKSYVDVRKIAEKFGGGGHIRAAGLSINSNILDAEKMILSEIQGEL
ncbi:phosphoesterase RecJ-like protein [Clostridium acetobutylicum]|uniref:Exopolyphosphatase family protein n=1 Tax=Clostridium acetobutylicum (strain ATCC 824 / DSM 792 / JCM 1419 / IAM 19013 / LMG 5710 / NBRC 13948 / NRRL B-527 / VKM B-1787 / 2291 / W) TaxID=272562 RepID=Q97I49_CLOAB|nr:MULTISPECIES: bifunctional oligoribonuclease/PAP phosphatase NrnA [Clostridium]AAK79769.1 Exopolyphosphatase family protein [Clostridium acetobutylicum ATCC 824]ADZ20854.1 Exopolyphosphatase family protein [Clostridium acetobutylicum EA 2018]AEI33909.1 exopolyphosphatase family protein [Clostridium acetobutylicum DSM 1731]AWV79796.1 bifunctional oligoribonuclease/PAP phosphatase NrnA [Clostridium acetobutylicum]MBC2394222.1 bifunctional oligoribonuclease/PAP phosphatase NrnA [Clostridium ac